VTFPETREARQVVVDTFILAHDSLVALEYGPDITSLVGAYNALSENVRSQLDKGEPYTPLPQGEFGPLYRFIARRISFIGEIELFASITQALSPIEPKAKEAIFNLHGLHNQGVPPYLLIEFAKSLADQI